MDVRASLLSVAPVTATQFGIFRIAFGAYLAAHFAHLLPYGRELFSNQGTLPDIALSPLGKLFPNVLARWDDPLHVTVFLGALTALSLLFMAGCWRRPVAVLLWYGWACLFNRNPLISNPGIPYVGLLLMLSAVVPASERWIPARLRGREPFQMPGWAFHTAWILMAVGYTYSGLVKLQSPSWIDGSALWHVLNNPLARDGLFREVALSLPMPVIRGMTWGALALEIGFLPLAVWRVTRPLAWAGAVSMHLGIVTLVSFADLTLGMLMLHLYTFYPRWLDLARTRIAILRGPRRLATT
jgi:hypothetical protein